MNMMKIVSTTDHILSAEKEHAHNMPHDINIENDGMMYIVEYGPYRVTIEPRLVGVMGLYKNKGEDRRTQVFARSIEDYMGRERPPFMHR